MEEATQNLHLYGILISGSNVSSPSVTPISIPSIGGGWKIFLFWSLNICLFLLWSLINAPLLSTSSPFSPNSVEDKILLSTNGCGWGGEGRAMELIRVLHPFNEFLAKPLPAQKLVFPWGRVLNRGWHIIHSL